MKERDAYNTMVRFLEGRYSQLPSEELCDLLGALHLAADGEPYDPAITEDWNAAVAAAKAEREAAPVPLRKAS
jgi:Ser/Thr protein kinase RdoA (MazF antagonist)